MPSPSPLRSITDLKEANILAHKLRLELVDGALMAFVMADGTSKGDAMYENASFSQPGRRSILIICFLLDEEEDESRLGGGYGGCVALL